MTKGAGIEGTYILATEFGEKLNIDEKTLQSARSFRDLLSVLPEVKILVDKIGVDNLHAMHDATEGGLLNAVFEVSTASNLGFKIFRNDVIVREETMQIAKEFNMDHLKLISSGTLVAAIPKSMGQDAVGALKAHGIDAAIIGEFIGDNRRILVENSGKETEVKKDIIDDIWLFLEKISVK